MARNKYPEVTEQKILEVSRRLFLEKGYDNTTIQDIVNQLDGLTKGAVYHHFKSKEHIMNTLCESMFFANNPFEKVKSRTDLNAIQKIREAIILNQSDEERMTVSIQAISILKDPRILMTAVEENIRVLKPLWLQLLKEGEEDGSITTEYPNELAELLSLSTFWLIPSIFPATPEELQHKAQFVMEMFAKMGLPIWDDEVKDLALETIYDINAENKLPQ